MESSSLERLTDASQEKWRDHLRHGDFWLNGYRRNTGHSVKVTGSGVYWIVGVGPMASFTRAISGYISEKSNSTAGPYEYVIKVDLNPTTSAEEAQGNGIKSIKHQLTLAAAKELNLLDQEYKGLKERHNQLQYYSYGCDGAAPGLEHKVRYSIAPLVGKKLSAKRYLLVVDNLRWPIGLDSFTRDCGLPPPMWANSRWLISATYEDAHKEKKLEDYGVLPIETDVYVVLLTMFALRQSAEHIFNTIRQGSIEYWHGIAINCFHYALSIFAKQSQVVAFTSDELIQQWTTLLPHIIIKEEESNTIVSSSKCSSMLRFGRVILEAFQKYSLLQLPFSPANEDHEATGTSTQFFAYHGLIAERITVDELANNTKKWISFPGDHGWHVSREWLFTQEEQEMGTAAFIVRGCQQQSPILSKLNHFLPELRFLRVLDLSYTPLKSLPSSISCLQNLRLLSLRGCHDLKTLFGSTTSSAMDSTKNISSPLSTLYHIEILDMNGVPFSHLTQGMAEQKTNLIYLDMSYSQITTFPPNYFQDMSNLEELILANCSNLVELPHSMAALSSLTTLEVTGTEIKYFPLRVFEKIQKLQSLKLIDNNNLISLTGPNASVHEIKLEGHPNLRSFWLISAPHVQRLSLRGCRKLESVEFAKLGALEELDLSGTSIKELPADIPNGTKLKRLLLLGVPSLLRFPWHMLERLPEVFYLDQCIEGNGIHSDQVPQLCVSDPMFFYSFRESCAALVRDGRFFQSFYVQVAPCSKNKRRLQHEDGMVDNKLHELLQKQQTYMDIHSSCCAEEIPIMSPITLPLRRTDRQVEITGMQQPSAGLYSLLSVTQSISVTCDTSIRDFSCCSNFHDLEECELRWCHKMEKVFDYNSKLENLRIVHVSNLKRLVWFCERSWSDFSSLEHLHLEDCPKLEAVIPVEVTLPSLKTIDILFCYNLKKIFHHFFGQDDIYQFPNLQRIRLEELPLLQHFNENGSTIAAPMWKELHIRGCWSLRRLPRLQDCRKKVQVNGERSWWNKLEWGSPLHSNSYGPKLPSKFASFDEHAEVTSYLR